MEIETVTLELKLELNTVLLSNLHVSNTTNTKLHHGTSTSCKNKSISMLILDIT